MTKLQTNKGISLIELLVAVGLGLLLVFSMLAFYSVSQQNSIEFHVANREQQSLRKMMNLLVKDIENTGGFECADPEKQIFSKNHYPKSLISIGDSNGQKQIIFVHPVVEEYLQQSLGIFKTDSSNDFKSAKPLSIWAGGCGQDRDSTPVYVGTTILETISLDTEHEETEAFVALSSTSTDTENNPKIKDGVVLYTYKKGTGSEPKIFLGFSPPKKDDQRPPTYIPKCTERKFEKCLITDEIRFNKEGGWIDPFAHMGFITKIDDDDDDDDDGYDNINQQLDNGLDKTYSLTQDAIDRIRAVKFVFKLNAGTDKEKTITRVIRFKNTHLMKLEK